jgi:hypothetical protein
LYQNENGAQSGVLAREKCFVTAEFKRKHWVLKQNFRTLCARGDMRMRYFMILVVTTWATAACADTLSFNLINESPGAVTSVTATVPGGTTPITLAAGIAKGATTVATLNRIDENCIYNISIKKADNTVVDMAETDLCQTSSIGIE